MKIKKILSLLIALMLVICLPLQALAAPVRDLQETQVVPDDAMQHLLDLSMSAAMLKDEFALAADASPSQGMQEAIFGLYSYLESGAAQATLSLEDCSLLYRSFFATGNFTMPSSSTCECVTLTKDSMTLDLSPLGETPLVGTYVYASEENDNHSVTLHADLFTHYGYFGVQAENVPETDLTWWASADITLNPNADSLYGWQLISYQLTEPYLDGLLSDWQGVDNEKCEYSVNLPSILGLADSDDENRTYQSADGTVTVNIACTAAQPYADAVTAFINDSGVQVTEEEGFSTFWALEEGKYTLVVADEGLNYSYTLTMEFPSERQTEFSLYAELIRNSLVVWTLNNG